MAWSIEVSATQRMFETYLGIDYSGAEAADKSLKGLRVYRVGLGERPLEVLPPESPRKYWTRRGLAEWITDQLAAGPATLVGIDHGFSFPLRYFESHHLPPDWFHFLDDFQRHWPTDSQHTYVDFVREGIVGDGAARMGHSRWRRLTEERCGAKSVFHFDVPGSVAKSTHAGLPWLRYLKQNLRERVHFWPFEGWHPPRDRSVIAEVYPAIWSKSYPREGRNPDQHDAYSIARWLQETDAAGQLPFYFAPQLNAQSKTIATIEGWILGCVE